MRLKRNHLSLLDISILGIIVRKKISFKSIMKILNSVVHKFAVISRKYKVCTRGLTARSIVPFHKLLTILIFGYNYKTVSRSEPSRNYVTRNQKRSYIVDQGFSSLLISWFYANYDSDWVLTKSKLYFINFSPIIAWRANYLRISASSSLSWYRVQLLTEWLTFSSVPIFGFTPFNFSSLVSLLFQSSIYTPDLSCTISRNKHDYLFVCRN